MCQKQSRKSKNLNRGKCALVDITYWALKLFSRQPSFKVMKRKDKRPDRVEISPEDLSLGMVDAEELNTIINGREQSATERNQMTADGDSQEQLPQVSKFARNGSFGTEQGLLRLLRTQPHRK